MSHTPGPWIAELFKSGGFGIHAPNFVPDDDQYLLVVCQRSGHDTRSAEMHANGRLIAAAPAMLEAIRAYIEERSGDADELMRAVWAKLENC